MNDKRPPDMANVPAAIIDALDRLTSAAENMKATLVETYGIESRDPDAALLDNALAESAGHDLIPSEVADRLFAGENPVRVIRDWRGLKQGVLATRVGISQSYLSEIERGKSAAADVCRAIADALNVSLDLIIPPKPAENRESAPA